MNERDVHGWFECSERHKFDTTEYEKKNRNRYYYPLHVIVERTDGMEAAIPNDEVSPVWFDWVFLKTLTSMDPKKTWELEFPTMEKVL